MIKLLFGLTASFGFTVYTARVLYGILIASVANPTALYWAVLGTGVGALLLCAGLAYLMSKLRMGKAAFVAW